MSTILQIFYAFLVFFKTIINNFPVNLAKVWLPRYQGFQKGITTHTLSKNKLVQLPCFDFPNYLQGAVHSLKLWKY